MIQFIEALIPISLFTAILLAWYFYIRARNKERMALIEKGVNASEIYPKRNYNFKFPWQKIGLLIIGIGLGPLVAMIIARLPAFNRFLDEGPLMLLFMLIFGGAAMILADRLDKKESV